MSTVHVGIGEYRISNKEGDEIKTFALGSCVAIIIYDRLGKTAGMMHIALPDSSVNEMKAKETPGYFVDTGLPLLLKKMNCAEMTARHFWIKLVGGSNIMDSNRHFDIGKRNVLAIKKYLWKNRLGIIGEDIEGSISRTTSIFVDTGEVIISSKGNSWKL